VLVSGGAPLFRGMWTDEIQSDNQIRDANYQRRYNGSKLGRKCGRDEENSVEGNDTRRRRWTFANAKTHVGASDVASKLAKRVRYRLAGPPELSAKQCPERLYKMATTGNVEKSPSTFWRGRRRRAYRLAVIMPVHAKAQRGLMTPV
jgi:hypothetical protein